MHVYTNSNGRNASDKTVTHFAGKSECFKHRLRIRDFCV